MVDRHLQIHAEAEVRVLDPLDDAGDLARFMHEEYEKAAREFGWETQEETSVAFRHLPEANKRVMLRVAERIIEQYMVWEATVRFSGPPREEP